MLSSKISKSWDNMQSYILSEKSFVLIKYYSLPVLRRTCHTEGGIGGFWAPQYRKKFGKRHSIAKNIAKYRNTSKSKLDVIPKLQLCMLSSNQT